MKLVTVQEMRELERRATEQGISTAQLMQRAGEAVARAIRSEMQGAAGRRVVVLVGPGNNGGDGLVAGRRLAAWGSEVLLYLLNDRSSEPLAAAAVDHGAQIALALQDTGRGELRRALGRADVVLDAVLGTGRSRPLEGLARDALTEVRAARAARPAMRVVALDIPTGLDADSGALDPAALPADVTVTLGFPKPGLYRMPGAAVVGRVVVADIGIPTGLAGDITSDLVTRELAASLLPERPPQSNKGTFGRLLVVAGSGNYVGASMLACRAAVRVGAGLVTLAAPASLVSRVAGDLPEATYLPLTETASGGIAREAAAALAPELPRYDALLAGCGLGQHPETALFLEELLLQELPLPPAGVLDADALNILAGLPGWEKRLRVKAVLTPHPGEMARLLGLSAATVQEAREARAREAAAAWNQVVVLKGAFTVVAGPEGRMRISPFAVPALASAGTGDVLAGAIAGLMAQGVGPEEAAAAGVFLHAAAGRRWSEVHGDAGLAASDLPGLLPDVLRDVKLAGASDPSRLSLKVVP